MWPSRTGHTSAQSDDATDIRLAELASRFDRTHAQAVWDAGLARLLMIETIMANIRSIVPLAGSTATCTRRAVSRIPGRPAPLTKKAALASELGFDATFVADVPFSVAQASDWNIRRAFTRASICRVGEGRACGRAAKSSGIVLPVNFARSPLASKRMDVGCAARIS